MAFDAFLILDGINGESQKTDFTGKIEIFSFSWGASNPTTVSATGGSGAGKVSLSDFSVMKTTDTATAPLFLACCQGSHIATGSVVLRKSGGTSKVNFLQYDFQQLFVSSVQYSGSSGGDDTPTESVSFSYGQVTITYMKQDAKGAGSKGGEAGWSAVTNSKV